MDVGLFLWRGKMENDANYVRPLPQPREGQPIQPGDYPIVEPKEEAEMEEEVTYNVPQDKLRNLGHRKQAKIEFTAAVWKVSTLADGGIRLVLDLSEDARKIMGELAECQQNGVILAIEATKT